MIYTFNAIYKLEDLNIQIDQSDPNDYFTGSFVVPTVPAEQLFILDDDTLLEDNNGKDAVENSQSKDTSQQTLTQSIFGGTANGGSDAGDYVWSRFSQEIEDEFGNTGRLYQIRVGKWTPDLDRGAPIEYEVKTGYQTYYAIWGDDGFKFQPGSTITVTDTNINGAANISYPGFENVTPDIPCFTAGTMIETSNGEQAVETLKVGDLVRTKDNGFQAIKWVGKSTVSNAVLERQSNLLPIRIRAGALGLGFPKADLLVSPQHRILVKSSIAMRMFGDREVLVPAKQLLAIDGIEQETSLEAVDYFHIMFDAHEIVYSNGAETESLYAGPQSLQALDANAREEILFLFPELKDQDFIVQPARTIPKGSAAVKMAERHKNSGTPMFS